MTNQTWQSVDDYLNQTLAANDDALDAALRDSAAAGLPPINVTPTQGKFLMLLARLAQANQILEIGTLGGYSTIWLARALSPSGKLITLEADSNHAAVAKSNIARAGLTDRVEIKIGKALDSLPIIEQEKRGPFDLIFIDADKVNNPAYIQWAIRLSRPRTIIVLDNVIREGKIVDAATTDPSIAGTRRALEIMGTDKRLISTALQTVGSKGYDGFAIAMVV